MTVILGTIIDFVSSHPSIFLVGFLLYIFIYVLSILFSGPKPGRNPFSASHVKPPKPLVTDHNLRNKVLKQRFKAQKVPEDLDTIIIGSGIGGLATAVLLGRAGKKVLVLEQHDQAGGCCHTFVDKGYEFDTGIHYLGKMMEGNQTRVMIDQLTDGQVAWTEMDPEFDVVAIGDPAKAKRIAMMSGSEEAFMKNLEKHFPTEKEVIPKFMKAVKESKNGLIGFVAAKIVPKWIVRFFIKTGLFHLIFSKYIKYSRQSIKSLLDSMTDNEEFKTVVTYIFGDIGMTPKVLNTMMYSALISHYIPGAYYPVGGSSEIAFQMIPIIERYGGRVLVNAPVSKILMNEKGRASGVRVQRQGGDIDLYAKRIVSDAGVNNTFKYLLPKEVAQKSVLYHIFDKVGPSVSYLTVFIGVKESSKDMDLPAGNTWFLSGTDVDRILEDYCNLTLEEAADSDVPLMFVSFPSAKDPSWEDRYPGRSVGLLITLCPYKWFQQWENQRCQHRAEEYVDLKERIGKQMWKQCEQLFPKLEGKLDFIDVGTPVSNKFYLGAPVGEMYGMEHDFNRFTPELSMHLRAQTDIPGLYLTGQDLISCGFSPSMTAGLLTASAILHRNLLNDLTAVTKEIRKQKKEN